MTRRDALVLRVAAGWTVFIWAVFVRNLVGDDTRAASFKIVHLAVAAVSVTLAVAIWRVASRSVRRQRERAGTPS